MRKILFSIFAALLIISCNDNELALESVITDTDLYGSIENIDATKTTMDKNNNVLWSEGDQLVAFMKTTLGSKYQIKEQYVGTTTGGFSKVADTGSGDDLESGQEIDHNVVVYPYSPDTWCMKNDSNTPTQSYKLNLFLPETQVYAENTFGNGAFPMVAVSSNNQLTFRNVCGGVKLQIKGVDKIKSIKLEGLADEAISGKSAVIGYVDGSAPTITMDAAKATKSITLDCGEGGVKLDMKIPTTFIISVPPVEFKSGMKITITDTDGMSRELNNTSPNTIKRSSLLTFPVITYNQEGVFELPDGALTSYEVSSEGGIIEIPVVTNQEYNVIIPEEAREWITLVDTKALRKDTITLNIAENTAPEARTAEMLITTAKGETLQVITINQASAQSTSGPANNEIWYTSTDGAIVEPYAKDVFGANIKSNIYENGRGVITFDGDVISIGNYAFYMSANLQSVHIPDNVTSIGTAAFRECLKLNDVYFNSEIQSIGNSAFVGCFDIYNSTYGSITFHINSIEDWCKINMPKEIVSGQETIYLEINELLVSNITIPETITAIKPYAFKFCYVSKVTIHEYVSSIGDQAFYDSGIKEVYCKSIQPPIGGSDMFEGNASGFKIYVPAVSEATYKAADGWSEYADKIVGISSGDADLSQYSDLSESGTANCYLVQEAGDYKFKAVKGNSTISVGDVAQAEVLWESFGTDVTPQSGALVASVESKDGYVTFITPETFRNGNAVIAAKDASGKILWSWHIWCSKEGWTDQVYANNAGTMMDRNLGATSATPGDVGALGLLYQWGRKDPFLGSSSISASLLAASTGNWGKVSSQQTVDYAVENPMTFICYDEWYSSSTEDQRWMDSQKTMYDPCPAGYRVPKGESDGFWAVSKVQTLYIDTYKGLYWKLSNGELAWYPAAGYRSYYDGELNFVGSYGYYWSSTPNPSYDSNAYFLEINHYGNVYPAIIDGRRGGGFSVRCLRE